jgi:regulator of sirC expression with transglutaminase-like and TPR domain
VAARSESWEAIAQAPESEIELARAALALAAEHYPGLDVAAYLRRIEAMAQELRRRLAAGASRAETLAAVNRYLFGELRFAGNRDDYYDPRNSFLNEVLDRRLGIPITLSVLYLEVGWRLGLPLHGVSFPGHFLVKCALEDGVLVLDPYERGAPVGLETLRQRLQVLQGAPPAPGVLERLLAAAPKREILARMLRNLKAIYLQRSEFGRALWALDRAIALCPEAAEEYRDRGLLYARLECFRAALPDLERYLVLRPGARDADAIARTIGELQRFAARLN